ncbi:hypothetical protein F5X97DRAFT_231646 [Nemania serpens]|nr:hypothetical protein F5X97DRAFT_231646 [Nemania serpens]
MRAIYVLVESTRRQYSRGIEHRYLWFVGILMALSSWLATATAGSLTNTDCASGSCWLGDNEASFIAPTGEIAAGSKVIAAISVASGDLDERISSEFRAPLGRCSTDDGCRSTRKGPSVAKGTAFVYVGHGPFTSNGGGLTRWTVRTIR